MEAKKELVPEEPMFVMGLRMGKILRLCKMKDATNLGLFEREDKDDIQIFFNRDADLELVFTISLVKYKGHACYRLFPNCEKGKDEGKLFDDGTFVTRSPRRLLEEFERRILGWCRWNEDFVQEVLKDNAA